MTTKKANAARRDQPKMDKKSMAISWAEMISLFLVLIALGAIYFKVYPKLSSLSGSEIGAAEKSQMDDLAMYINAYMGQIKTSTLPNEFIYPIDIDGSKYVIVVANNCQIDQQGNCERGSQKTKLCLRRLDISSRDYCSAKTINSAFVQDNYQIEGKKLAVRWEGSKLNFYSS